MKITTCERLRHTGNESKRVEGTERRLDTVSLSPRDKCADRTRFRSSTGCGSGRAASHAAHHAAHEERTFSPSERQRRTQPEGVSSPREGACRTARNESKDDPNAARKRGQAASRGPAAPTTSIPERTTSTSGPASGAKVPYISQFRPNGADANYVNGSSNCGPTSMAMIARYFGYGAEMTDAQLVTHFNLADGRATGATNADGIKKMAALMGKPVEHRLGADLAFLDRSLAEGKPVAARGIFSSVRHYIVVTGKDAQGNYTVSDPASSSRKTVTPSELSAFIQRHPEGAFFGIG